MSELDGLPITGNAIWIDAGTRRRADFAFADGVFGFYRHRSKNIVPVQHCPLCCAAINDILPAVASLPWGGAGAVLITACDNGIDIAVSSAVPYFSSEFKNAVMHLDVLRVTWNGRIVIQNATPIVKFGDVSVEYPSGAFLQPTIVGADILRNMVVAAAAGMRRCADLFCGLGNFTYALNADGFDIAGAGVRRDLFHNPLTVGMLNKYDCVVMDPPRAGAIAQCTELVKSNVRRVIYISCNPQTWARDAEILKQKYNLVSLVPVDQFVGSAHWELFSVFEKN